MGGRRRVCVCVCGVIMVDKKKKKKKNQESTETQLWLDHEAPVSSPRKKSAVYTVKALIRRPLSTAELSRVLNY